MRPILERCAEVGATVAREGSEFGVLERGQSRSAGRCSPCRASAASTTRSSCRCTARTRRRTRRWRSPRSRRSSAPGTDQAARRRSWSGRASPRSTRRAGWSGSAARRRSCSTRAHNPHGMAATVDRAGGGVRLPPPGRGGRRCSPTRTSTGLLDLLEPVVDADRGAPEQLAAGDAGRRAGRARRSRSSARTGCTSRRDMPDAIEAAVALAEEDVDGELQRRRACSSPARWSPSPTPAPCWCGRDRACADLRLGLRRGTATRFSTRSACTWREVASQPTAFGSPTGASSQASECRAAARPGCRGVGPVPVPTPRRTGGTRTRPRASSARRRDGRGRPRSSVHGWSGSTSKPLPI